MTKAKNYRIRDQALNGNQGARTFRKNLAAVLRLFVNDEPPGGAGKIGDYILDTGLALCYHPYRGKAKQPV